MHFFFLSPPHSSNISLLLLFTSSISDGPGDHIGGWYTDHHRLHPGGLHHAGLRWLLLHRREPQHGRPAGIARQQQLHGMPQRRKSAANHSYWLLFLAIAAVWEISIFFSTILLPPVINFMSLKGQFQAIPTCSYTFLTLRVQELALRSIFFFFLIAPVTQ